MRTKITLYVLLATLLSGTLARSQSSTASPSTSSTFLAQAQQSGLHFGSRGWEPPAIRSDGHQRAKDLSNLSIGSFGMIDFPRASGTIADGINNKGHIVGGDGGSDVLSYPTHSFVLKGNSFRAIDYPGAISTEANAINDSEVVVGYYKDSAGGVHGFRFSGGTYLPIDHPRAKQPVGTVVWGINNAGDIVGGYGDGTKSSGFLLSNGVYSDIFVPGSVYTLALGINTFGQIVGWYGDSSGNVHGFLLDSGTYTTIDYPGFPENYVEAINDNGQMVGGYGNPGPVYWQHGFLYQNGQFTSFDVPFGPPAVTLPSNINNHGTIVGTYQDNSGAWYGFIATVGR